MVTIASNEERWNVFGCDCRRSLGTGGWSSVAYFTRLVSQFNPYMNDSDDSAPRFVMPRTARAHMNRGFRADWLRQTKGCWGVSERFYAVDKCKVQELRSLLPSLICCAPRGLKQRTILYKKPFIPACVPVKRWSATGTSIRMVKKTERKTNACDASHADTRRAQQPGMSWDFGDAVLLPLILCQVQIHSNSVWRVITRVGKEIYWCNRNPNGRLAFGPE